ncbi:MAG TPA: hypothetical protein DEA96_00645 [Leptospiraceae bacterium]|mgnify:CR=1 FL=1|nr:hypothetical protein [Spirochaetaceae bacterium]HBS03441.1 hypothetical protein [Leptospiraceae bacterium]|tara:strand:- start:4242 stop:5198 length:957 start_codon:yes stop_codon:yes gene_type:complete
MRTVKALNLNKDNRFRAAGILMLLFSVAISSCTSLDQKMIPAGQELENAGPLEMRAGIEPYYQRIDIFRQQNCTTRTTTNADGTITTSRECTPVPYSPMGVFLGNGIFVDVRGNIAVDLVTVTGLRNNNKFTMRQELPGLFSSGESRVSRDGNTITIFEPGLFSDDEVIIKIRPDGLDLEDGVRLVQDSAGIRYTGVEKTTIFGFEIGSEPPEVTINSANSLQAGPIKIVRDAEGNIQVGGLARFSKKPDHIEIQYAGNIFADGRKEYIYYGEKRMAIVNDDKSLGTAFFWNDQSVQIQRVHTIFQLFGKDSVVHIDQ